MPQFSPGQSKNAIVPAMVQPSGLSCQLEVFLGPNESTKVATSGLKSFISTGVQQSVAAPVMMPSVDGTYHVYIDLYVAGYYLDGYQAMEDVVVAEPYPIVFTSAVVSPATIESSSGWWGTTYYAVFHHTILWIAAHRVPELEGGGSGNIHVSWELTKDGQPSSGVMSYGTTPQTKEPSGVPYFPSGNGSVGWPYAGGQAWGGSTRPVSGLWNWVMTIKADVGGVVYGENSFAGTVQVT